MAAELKQLGREAVGVPFDVTDMAAVAAGIADIEATLGPVEILVNNVGTLPHGMLPTPFEETPEALWKQHIDNNLYGTLNCSRCVVDKMRERGWGRIIAISSDAGRVGHFGSSVYGAAKAGLINLSGTLAIEWAPKVRVNSIAAGLIRTEQAHLHYGDEKGIARVSETVPLKRLGTPEDIAGACMFFASPLASYVSGANLVLHGGGETPAFLAAASVNRGE